MLGTDSVERPPVTTPQVITNSRSSPGPKAVLAALRQVVDDSTMSPAGGGAATGEGGGPAQGAESATPRMIAQDLAAQRTTHEEINENGDAAQEALDFAVSFIKLGAVMLFSQSGDAA